MRMNDCGERVAAGYYRRSVNGFYRRSVKDVFGSAPTIGDIPGCSSQPFARQFLPCIPSEVGPLRKDLFAGKNLVDVHDVH